MKINIVTGYGANDVRQIEKILGTMDLPILNNQSGEFVENSINILTCDYTPVITGDIIIKYPGEYGRN